MKLNCYLSIKKSGSVRVTKGKPDLSWDEIAVGLNIEIPKELFLKPQLNASIVVPPEAVTMPEISVDTIDNIREVIQQNTGLELKINFEKVEE